MTTITVEYEFDFPEEAKRHSFVLDLNADYSNDPTLAELKRLALGSDLTDDKALEHLGWEFDYVLQTEVILPNLKFSNFVVDVDKDEMTFDVELNLWGTLFKGSDTLYEAAYNEVDANSSDAELFECVEDYYSGSHHYFDILEIDLTVNP